jgi:hypothetical protein
MMVVMFGIIIEKMKQVKQNRHEKIFIWPGWQTGSPDSAERNVKENLKSRVCLNSVQEERK